MQLIEQEDKYIIEISAAAKTDDHFWQEIKFTILAKKWEEETKFFSFTRQIVANEHYQQIISMGLKIVPLLLKDLQRTNRHWFFALRSITETNPVPKEHEGKVQLMVNDWISWGKKRKLI